MPSLPPWIWMYLGVLVILVWVILDFRSWLRFLRTYHQLQHEGRWEELDVRFQREFRAFRPWVRLVHAVPAPGILDLLYAVFQQQRGNLEDALRRTELVLARTGPRSKLRGQAESALALILAELGRYDDAHAAAARARTAGASVQADHHEALCCFYQGRLEDGLALARRATAEPKGNIARGLASALLLLQGEYKSALEILLDKPLDVSVLYTEDAMRKLMRTSEGRRIIDAHRQHWAGVVEPLRFIYASFVYLELGDLESLGFTLERVAATCGGHPSLRAVEAQLQACRCAGLGDPAGLEEWLRKGAAILQSHHRRASNAEFHRFAGRAALMLGKTGIAVERLQRSLELTLHPMEKHLARFWLARACEAAGDRTRAAELYGAVAADGIASKYRDEARAKASPPAPSEPPPAS